MKKLLLIPLALLCIGAGPCTTLESGLYNRVLVYETNTVPHVIVQTITNIVRDIVTVTNVIGEPVRITNDVARIIPVYYTNYETIVLTATNLVTRDVVTKGVDTVGNLIPVPFADTATALIGLMIGGYAAWRNKSNKRKSEQIVGTLVDSIDGARKVIKTLPNGEEIDGQVVRTIKDIQESLGTRPEIHQVLMAKKKSNS
jgi:hypothetical protein